MCADLGILRVTHPSDYLANGPPDHHSAARALATDHGLPDAETEPLADPDRLSIRRSGDGRQRHR